MPFSPGPAHWAAEGPTLPESTSHICLSLCPRPGSAALPTLVSLWKNQGWWRKHRPGCRPTRAQSRLSLPPLLVGSSHPSPRNDCNRRPGQVGRWRPAHQGSPSHAETSANSPAGTLGSAHTFVPSDCGVMSPRVGAAPSPAPLDPHLVPVLWRSRRHGDRKEAAGSQVGTTPGEQKPAQGCQGGGQADGWIWGIWVVPVLGASRGDCMMVGVPGTSSLPHCARLPIRKVSPPCHMGSATGREPRGARPQAGTPSLAQS